MIHSDHQCDQVTTENALKAHLKESRLVIPTKTRDFVNQLVEQSRQSGPIARLFAQQMVQLRDQIKSTLDQQAGLVPGGRQQAISTESAANRVSLVKVNGLGRFYSVQLALRLNLEPLLAKYQAQILAKYNTRDAKELLINWSLCCLILPSQTPDSSSKRCQLRTVKYIIPIERFSSSGQQAATAAINSRIFETTLEPKLILAEQPNQVAPVLDDSVAIDIHLMLQYESRDLNLAETLMRKPVLIQSVNVPTC